MLGFVVVLLDAVWVVVCGLRFGPMYPDSVPQLLACLFRDISIVALCYIFVKDYLQQRAQFRTLIYFVACIVFMAVWFTLAPSPAYTDWTFALRNGYPVETVVTSFLISHVVGKTLTGLMFLSYF